MTNVADTALERLRSLRAEFDAFCSQNGKASEADTRYKLIEKILIEVLQWPEADISREEHVSGVGYIDTSLKLRNRIHIAVEAKCEGIAFTIPLKTSKRYLKLSGTLVKDKEVLAVIDQVRAYCSEAGIRYAIATNGNAWIIFRAMREDMAWREGQAIVYSSLDEVIADFTFFWNLLSYECIHSGSLDGEFGSQFRASRELHRVVDVLWNADQPLPRNRLHLSLLPLMSAVFEDIADQAQIEILQKCYVHSRSLKIVASELEVVITDEIPKFLKAEGAVQISQGSDDAGQFGKMLNEKLPTKPGHLCLLLGGIGSGKTTFLKRYKRTVGHTVLEENALFFTVDFLKPPSSPEELDEFVWSGILKEFRERYEHLNLETRGYLHKIFEADIRRLEETVLKYEKKGAKGYEELLSPYLAKWQEDIPDYVPKLLQLCKPDKGTKIVLFVDNVDQLSPEFQTHIFFLAQRVTGLINSITVVSLREESYYTASVQRTFTAYNSHRFHVASPKFMALIASRINYSRDILAREQAEEATGHAAGDVKKDMSDFLTIAEQGILERSHVIVNFVEALCFGNMRLGLQMFTTFMASGSAEVDKMLRIYRRDGRYQIAYHEFVKAIMLGHRKYYRESASPIMNVFDCGLEKNASHFTSLRLLNLLIQNRGQNSSEGRGYFEIGRAISLFEDVFDNREDVIRSLMRLVNKQLVEVDTRSTETILGAGMMRVTSAGWYYFEKLARSFVYLDLVLQDTPLDDSSLMKSLKDSVYRVDNLSDPEEDKLLRMQARFSRVSLFLDYLGAQEQVEAKIYGLIGMGGVMAGEYVPGIRQAFEKQRDHIASRISENREKYVEDSYLAFSPDDQAALASFRHDLDELAS